MKYSYLLFILFIITSCSVQKNSTEKLLRNCINEKVNKNIKAFYGKPEFDFYDLILEMEDVFVKNKLLKQINKKSYLTLLNQIISFDKPEYKKTYFQQEKLMDKYGFTPFSTEIIFNQCPYSVSVNIKDGEGKNIYDQGVILSKLMAKGYDKEDLLKNLINSVNEKKIKNITYRAPIILITMMNIDRKYNKSYKKLEEYKNRRANGGVNNLSPASASVSLVTVLSNKKYKKNK